MTQKLLDISKCERLQADIAKQLGLAISYIRSGDAINAALVLDTAQRGVEALSNLVAPYAPTPPVSASAAPLPQTSEQKVEG